MNFFKQRDIALKSIEQVSAECLINVKKRHKEISRLKEYHSPLSMAISESGFSENMFNLFIQSVQKNLPLLQKYIKVKSQKKGYENGLPFYELSQYPDTINSHFPDCSFPLST